MKKTGDPYPGHFQFIPGDTLDAGRTTDMSQDCVWIKTEPHDTKENENAGNSKQRSNDEGSRDVFNYSELHKIPGSVKLEKQQSSSICQDVRNMKKAGDQYPGHFQFIPGGTHDAGRTTDMSQDCVWIKTEPQDTKENNENAGNSKQRSNDEGSRDVFNYLELHKIPGSVKLEKQQSSSICQDVHNMKKAGDQYPGHFQFIPGGTHDAGRTTDMSQDCVWIKTEPQDTKENNENAGNSKQRSNDEGSRDIFNYSELHKIPGSVKLEKQQSSSICQDVRNMKKAGDQYPGHFQFIPGGTHDAGRTTDMSQDCVWLKTEPHDTKENNENAGNSKKRSNDEGSRDVFNYSEHHKIPGSVKEYRRNRICSSAFQHESFAACHDHTYIKKDQKKCNLISTRNNQLYSCDIYNKVFINCSRLKKHKVRHSNISTFQCDLCNKLFTSYNWFKSHKCNHCNIIRYHCYMCKKAFKLPNMLYKHMFVRSGVKNYECNIYNK